MCGHTTSLPPNLNKCLYAWLAGCLTSILPHRPYSHILSVSTYVNVRRKVNHDHIERVVILFLDIVTIMTGNLRLGYLTCSAGGTGFPSGQFSVYSLEQSVDTVISAF
jgi:hypothetical protein